MHLALSNFILKILFQLFHMIFPLLDVSTFTYGFYNLTSNFYYDFPLLDVQFSQLVYAILHLMFVVTFP
jgi:hypothetical protein